MNIAVRPALPRTLAEFLDWNEYRADRHEFKDGSPCMMVHVSRNHAVLTGTLMALLFRQFAGSEWVAVASDFGVAIGEDLRFPDIVVIPRDTPGKALLTREPALIIEVLSPSSLHIDMREKAEEYLALSSLQAYIVASQDEPRIWVWLRGEEGLFPRQPTPIAGADKLLEVPALSLSLPLVEVYAGIG